MKCKNCDRTIQQGAFNNWYHVDTYTAFCVEEGYEVDVAEPEFEFEDGMGDKIPVKTNVCRNCGSTIEFEDGGWLHDDGWVDCYPAGGRAGVAEPSPLEKFNQTSGPNEFYEYGKYGPENPVESNSGSENRVAQNMGPKNRSAMFESGEAQPNPAAPQTGGSLSDNLYHLTNLLYDNRHKLRAVGIEEDVLQALEAMGEAWDRVLDTFGVEEV